MFSFLCFREASSTDNRLSIVSTVLTTVSTTVDARVHAHVRGEVDDESERRDLEEGDGSTEGRAGWNKHRGVLPGVAETGPAIGE